MGPSKRVGILALQGAFVEHARMLDAIGAESFEIRCPSDLNREMDALVLPGGESTAQISLLDGFGMKGTIKQLISSGLPTLGVCAGAILLAEHVDDSGDSRGSVRGLRTFPCSVLRNAYGRQCASFVGFAEIKGSGTVPMTFIRAPQIVSVGPDVEILAQLDGKTVAARWKNQIVATFHPELDGCTALHRMLLGS